MAQTVAEIAGAQRLRYRVFVTEMGAKASADQHARGIEQDEFDPYFDHLILIDNNHRSPDPADHVVGAYRLMRGDIAAKALGFYSLHEYDLTKLTTSGRNIVELGRSCVDAKYRGGTAILSLWNGVAEYVAKNNIEILFGVASFPGTDPMLVADALANLHRNYLAPQDIRVRALAGKYLEMARPDAIAIDPAKALRQTPPLIKAYLRLGGFVGEGAVVDRDFNTIDVCLVMDTKRMQERYRKFYARDPG